MEGAVEDSPLTPVGSEPSKASEMVPHSCVTLPHKKMMLDPVVISEVVLKLSLVFLPHPRLESDSTKIE